MPALSPLPEWIAHPPPIAPPAPPAAWGMPPGFVPMPPPPRRRTGLLLGTVVAVVVLAAAGWFGYQALGKHDSASPPTSVAQSVIRPDGAVSYTSAEGHFRVVFPTQPQIVTQTTTVGTHSFKLTMAVDPAEGLVVGGVTVTPDAPAGAMTTTLRGFVAGLQTGGSVRHVANGTYRGHPSVRATVRTRTGVTEFVVAYAYDNDRMYMLLARERAALTRLERRFHPIP